MSPTHHQNPELIKLGHELNNIWTGLIGSTEILQMSIAPDASEHEFIEMLLDGIERGEQITQKIRAIAHGEAENSDNTTPHCPCIDTSTISLGNPTLDQDHRQLETMMQQLAATQSTAEGSAIANQIFDRCLRHFYREEQLMLQCPEYPFRDHHHETHCALLTELQHLQTQLNHHHDPIAIQKVADLLSIHIMGMDGGMMPYIKALPELTQFVYTLPSDVLLQDYFQPHAVGQKQLR